MSIDRENIFVWRQELGRFLQLFNVGVLLMEFCAFRLESVGLTQLNLASNLRLDEIVAMRHPIVSPNEYVLIFIATPRSYHQSRITPQRDLLPAAPALFFGRDTLVGDTVESLLKYYHVALMGWERAPLRKPSSMTRKS